MPVQPIWPTAGAPTTGTIPSDNLLNLANYYVARLIFQYATQPNAQRLVALLVKQGLMDDLATQLSNAFDLYTAVGVQLDTLGKYIGASRTQGTAISPGYFSLWDSTSALNPALYQGTWNPATDAPTIPAAGAGNTGWWYVASANGTSTSPIGATFTVGDVIKSNGSAWSQDTTDCGNGLTDSTNQATNQNATFYGYGQTNYSINSLTDAAFRVALILRSIVNTSDGTLSSIMTLLNTLFPGQILLVDNQNMTLTYYVSSALSLTGASLASLLPKPMGVGITVTVVTPNADGTITIPP
jgi:hypothetical protein